MRGQFAWFFFSCVVHAEALRSPLLGDHQEGLSPTHQVSKSRVRSGENSSLEIIQNPSRGSQVGKRIQRSKLVLTGAERPLAR